MYGEVCTGYKTFDLKNGDLFFALICSSREILCVCVCVCVCLQSATVPRSVVADMDDVALAKEGLEVWGTLYATPVLFAYEFSGHTERCKHWCSVDLDVCDVDLSEFFWEEFGAFSGFGNFP